MNIPAKTIVKVTVIAALVISAFSALVWLGYLSRVQLGWIFTAAFLALSLNPTVTHIARWMPRKSRGLAIGVVLLAVSAVLALMIGSLLPPLVEQTRSLISNLPNMTDNLIHNSGFISDTIQKYNLVDRVRESQDQITHYATSAGGQALDVARGLFSAMVTLITILGLTFFMLLEGPKWVELAWRAVPAKHDPHARKLAGQMYGAVTGYVTGNLATSLVAVVVTSILLMILRVPYAVPLGILVGILDLVPLVGATMAAVVVVVVALFTSMTAGIVMAVFFAVYQQIENHVLQPIIYGKTVQISPLVVLIAILLGAAVGGIVGAIVAIPIAASLQILIKDYAERRLVKR